MSDRLDSVYSQILLCINQAKDVEGTKTLGTELKRMRVLNLIANACSTAVNHIKSDLLPKMEGKTAKITLENLNDGTKLRYSCSIVVKKRSKVDVKTLRKLVSDEVFMSVVSAGCEDTKKAAGELIYTKCAVSEDGNPSIEFKEI